MCHSGEGEWVVDPVCMDVNRVNWSHFAKRNSSVNRKKPKSTAGFRNAALFAAAGRMRPTLTVMTTAVSPHSSISISDQPRSV